MRGIAMILDSSVMMSIIEEKDANSKKMLKRLSYLKVKSERAIVLTTLSSFQNSIWRSDSKAEIKNIKKLLDLVDILPDLRIVDFRNDKAVTDGLVNFAKDLTERAEKIREARK